MSELRAKILRKKQQTQMNSTPNDPTLWFRTQIKFYIRIGMSQQWKERTAYIFQCYNQ